MKYNRKLSLMENYGKYIGKDGYRSEYTAIDRCDSLLTLHNDYFTRSYVIDCGQWGGRDADTEICSIVNRIIKIYNNSPKFIQENYGHEFEVIMRLYTRIYDKVEQLKVLFGFDYDKFIEFVSNTPIYKEMFSKGVK